MTLENVYYVSQTIAVAAILGSLIVLIAQLRQSNRIMRETAIQNQVEGLQDISRAIFETPGMADIWNRGTKDFSRLTDEERIRFVTFMTYSFRIWEGLHATYVRGEIDDELWRTHARLLRDIQPLEGVKGFWVLRRHLFSESFAGFYESNTNEDAARDIYGWNSRESVEALKEGSPL